MATGKVENATAMVATSDGSGGSGGASGLKPSVSDGEDAIAAIGVGKVGGVSSSSSAAASIPPLQVPPPTQLRPMASPISTLRNVVQRDSRGGRCGMTSPPILEMNPASPNIELGFGGGGGDGDVSAFFAPVTVPQLMQSTPPSDPARPTPRRPRLMSPPYGSVKNEVTLATMFRSSMSASSSLSLSSPPSSLSSASIMGSPSLVASPAAPPHLRLQQSIVPRSSLANSNALESDSDDDANLTLSPSRRDENEKDTRDDGEANASHGSGGEGSTSRDGVKLAEALRQRRGKVRESIAHGNQVFVGTSSTKANLLNSDGGRGMWGALKSASNFASSVAANSRTNKNNAGGGSDRTHGSNNDGAATSATSHSLPISPLPTPESNGDAGFSISSLLQAIGPTAPGRFCNEFERLQLLGKGNFGMVWKCRNLLDGSLYAIKIMHARNSAGTAGEDDIRNFLDEVWALSALTDHPNLIRFHSSWMEYTSSLELARWGPGVKRASSSGGEVVGGSAGINSSAQGKTLTIFIQCEYCDRGTLLRRWGVERGGEKLSYAIVEADAESTTPLGKRARGGDDRSGLRKSTKVGATDSTSISISAAANTSDRNGQQRPPPTEHTLLCALADVVRGLKHIHDCGRTHGDIKPENIYCKSLGHIAKSGSGSSRTVSAATGSLHSESEGSAYGIGVGSGVKGVAHRSCEHNDDNIIYKLGDFGLVRPYGQRREDQHLGTGLYLVPKIRDLQSGQLSCEDEAKCDVYMLGASILDMACGNDFKLNTEWRKNINRYIGKLRSQGYSDDFANLLKGCLEPVHRNRISVEQIMCKDIIKPYLQRNATSGVVCVNPCGAAAAETRVDRHELEKLWSD